MIFGMYSSSPSDPSIRFLLNGKPVTVKDIDPTRSVLNFLRYDLGLTGSKEGCAEGDCGACTAVIAEVVEGELTLKSVNSCIQFVPVLHGKALYTVEYLRQENGALHPVQQSMVDCHGSQCGFCTPGFIMSMWNVYVDHSAENSVASDADLRTALSGNLCRCTGYRPILEAGKKMFDLPQVDFDRQAVINQLSDLMVEENFEYQFEAIHYYSPTSLDHLLTLKHENPDATLLAGSTDVGLWVNKQFRDLGNIIYLGNVKALKHIEENAMTLRIGACVSLSDAFAAIVAHYPQVKEQWERFASVPIRNAGTLGGNVANGSPIGDSMPWLIALDAQVVLADRSTQRTIPLEDLYVDYMKKSMTQDEIVEAIIIPLPQDKMLFRTYKLSKRYDSDISAVCAAFSITIENERITEARIAMGGMAATPKRASETEAMLTGKVWGEETAKAAMDTLSKDYAPLSDMRASSENRIQSAENLLYRFYLETRPYNPLPLEDASVFAERGV